MIEPLTKLSEHTFHRGKMIEDVSVIEEAIGYFISIHYFGKFNANFSAEILEDEFFGIQLRKSVLKTILAKYHPHIKFPLKEFEELQGLRNIIAHARKRIDITYYPDREPTSGKSYYLYRGVRKDCAEIEERFYKLKNIVRDAVVKLPGMPPMKEVTQDEQKKMRLINGAPGFPTS